ncbi:MAG: ABC transporter permease [Clostridia bacterium]|nr:ABC transporter permease [Clostridia bacterium]
MKSIFKMTFRTVRTFKGRFIALCLIVALSAGFFAGLKLTTDSLRNTGNIFLSEHNMYDYRLYSTLGFDKSDVDNFKGIEGVENVEGGYTADILVDFEGNNMALKMLSIPQSINTVSLDYGRLPTAPNEVLADAERFKEGDIGKKITLSPFDENGAKSLKNTEYIIVGIVHSPLYLGIDRGTTTIGSGALNSFLYCNPDNFKMDAYTEINVTLTQKEHIYTEEYKALIDTNKERIKATLDSCATHRYNSLFNELKSQLPFITEEMASELGLEKPQTFLLTRSENAGYVNFENDSGIVGEVASVLPVFFILIAILVCITTMTRMVDEERNQLGILKALGFSNGKIASKYLLYAGSATLLGWVVGFFLCSWGVPAIFWMAYNALYNFAPLTYYFSPSMLAITLSASLICILGSTYISVRRELVSSPASLIRPKASKGGKRILLEKIPLWKKLPFLQKIIFRNMFRYKQRLIMMLVGIGCCCGLLLTAFGVRNSMIDIANLQYDDVQRYKIEVTFEDEEEIVKEFSAFENISYMTTSKGLVDVKSDKTMSSVNLIAFDDWNEITSYWHLANEQGDVLAPSGTNVIINNKIADTLNLKVGDTIEIVNADMKSTTVTVGAIYDNYIFSYIFMDSVLFEGAFGEYQKNTAFIKTSEDGVTMGEKLTALDGITSISDLTSTKNSVNDALDCLNYIIWLIVAFCAALAFIVTFNLTNINLAERSREIATVEVLGFYPKETNSYVLRENILLSIVASIVGIPIGYLFHYVVMSMVVVDSFAFKIYIAPESYFLAFGFSILFAFVVNLFMRRQITKIPMVESLKAVE